MRFAVATHIWDIGTMPPSTHAQTLTIVARVTATGKHRNTATISAPAPFDPDPANNTASVAVQAAAQPADLALTKTVNPPRITPGASATFTLTVVNNGPGTATAAAVHDSMPSGLRITSVTPASCITEAQHVTCQLGAVSARGTRRITVRVTAASPGDYRNLAHVNAQAPDLVSGNNTASAMLTVITPPPAPNGSGGQVAATGVDLRRNLGAALALVALGMLTLAWGRRRPRRRAR